MVSITKSTLKHQKKYIKPKKQKNNKTCLTTKHALRISNKRHIKRSNASPTTQNTKLKHKTQYNSYAEKRRTSHIKPHERAKTPEILLKTISKTSKSATPRKRINAIRLTTQTTSNKSHKNTKPKTIKNKKSNKPQDKSSRTPQTQKYAQCIRQPHIKSNKTQILSRSSKAHNNGETQPISKILHETANKPLKQRDNSKTQQRTHDTRNAIQTRNKLSNAKHNKCSLHKTLQ